MMFFFLEAEAGDEAVDDFLLGRLLAKGLHRDYSSYTSYNLSYNNS